MMTIWESISMLDYLLMGGVVVLLICQLCYWLILMAAPLRAFHKNPSWRKLTTREEAASQSDTNQEGVSVIICARNEAANLRPYLQALLEQDYPHYEVIVVNDGSQDATQEVLDEYLCRYPNLRLTFVPVEARIISSKKLALTLAVKAARYDILLLTDADCRPESVHWIQHMVAPFRNKDIEVVLGYSPYFTEHWWINDIIRYDTLFNGLHYLSRALMHHPYMGVGRNLAYRKSAFLQANGFAGQLSHIAGDDDLLVNRMATGRNTAVVLSRDSLIWSVPETTLKNWLHQKRRHLSVAHSYRLGTRLSLAFEPVTRGLFYVALILAFVFGSAFVATVALTALVLRLIVQLVVINRSAKAFGEQPFALEILWMDMILPLVSLFFLSTVSKKQRTRW